MMQGTINTKSWIFVTSVPHRQRGRKKFRPRYVAEGQSVLAGTPISLSVCPSACLSTRNNSSPTARILINIKFNDFSRVHQEYSSLNKIWQESRGQGALYEYLKTFMTKYRLILLRIKNFSDQSCRENQNTHIMTITFFPQNLVFYGIMWRNVVESDRPQMTIQYGIYKMRYAYRITKAWTHTYS